MRQSKTLILSTNVDKKSLVAEFYVAICRQTKAVETLFLAIFYRRSCADPGGSNFDNFF